jgi:excisionase family DNA binding protein
MPDHFELSINQDGTISLQPDDFLAALTMAKAHDALLLRVSEVADRLDCSRATADRLIADGSLPSVTLRSGRRKKLLRVSKKALDRWIERDRAGKKGVRNSAD